MNATMHARAGERQFVREREVSGLYTTQKETTDDTLRKLFELTSPNASEEVPDAFDFLTLLGPPTGKIINTASLVEQQQTLTDCSSETSEHVGFAADPTNIWSSIIANDCSCERLSVQEPSADLGIRLAEEFEKRSIVSAFAAGYFTGPNGATLPFLCAHPSFKPPVQQSSALSHAAQEPLLPSSLLHLSQDQLAVIRFKYLEELHKGRSSAHHSSAAGNLLDAASMPNTGNPVPLSSMQQHGDRASPAVAHGVQHAISGREQQHLHSSASPMQHIMRPVRTQQLQSAAAMANHTITRSDSSTSTTSPQNRSHAQSIRLHLLKQLTGEDPMTPDQAETSPTAFNRKKRTRL